MCAVAKRASLVMGHSNAPFRAGTAISQREGDHFGGGEVYERAGDFAIFTGACNQRVLLGNVGNQTPCIGVESNAMTVRRKAQATSLRLVIADDYGAAATGVSIDSYLSSNAAHYASNLTIAVDHAARFATDRFPALGDVAAHASNRIPLVRDVALAASNLFAASRTNVSTSNLSASNAVVAGTLAASNVSTAALSASNAWVAGDARVTGTLTAGLLTVDGDLVINGSNVLPDARQQVVDADSIRVLNAGQVGAGVSAGRAGIRVDRGTACNVDLVFDETVGMFRISGVPGGALETIATRPWVVGSIAPFRDAASHASNQVPVVLDAASFASNNMMILSPLGDAAASASNRVSILRDAAASASNRVGALLDAAASASNQAHALGEALATGYGVFGLSTSNYGVGVNRLRFGNTQFANRITNNGDSIAIRDAGVYAFMVILDAKAQAQAQAATLRVQCKYWDGASWVLYQSCEDRIQSVSTFQFMVQSSANQTWAMFLDGGSTLALGAPGNWWSRWIVHEMKASVPAAAPPSSFSDAAIAGASFGTVSAAASRALSQTASNVGTVEWAIVGGAPPGSSLSATSSTGATLNLAHVGGAYTIVVRATGSSGVPATASYTVNILEAPDIAPISAKSGDTTSGAFVITPVQTNAHAGTIAWSIALDPVVQDPTATQTYFLESFLDAATGEITIPARIMVNAVTVTVTATGPTGLSDSESFSLKTFGSEILGVTLLPTITTLVPNLTGSTLLFRKSIDSVLNNPAFLFHSRCRAKSPILFVAKLDNGCIVTAYSAEVSLNGLNRWLSAPSGSCWLNTLQDQSGTIRTARAYNTVYPEMSIFDFIGSGVAFGGGFDFAINPYTYQTGHNWYSFAGITDSLIGTPLPGTTTYTTVELEVYAVPP